MGQGALHSCVNHIFCVLYSNALISGALLTPERLHLRVSEFLEVINSSPGSILSKYKPTHPESHPQLLPSLGNYTVGYWPPVLITTGPGARQLGWPLYSRAHWNYSSQPILSLLALPISTQRSHSEGSYTEFPLLLPLDAGSSPFVPHSRVCHLLLDFESWI